MISPSALESKLELLTNDRAKADLLNRFSFEGRNIDPKYSGELASRALNISEAIHYDKGEAESLLHLGFSHMQLAQHEKAYENLFRCISIYEKTGDESGMAHAQYNIGILHVRVGNFSDGISVLQKSLAWRERNNDKAGMAACYFQLAYINVHFNDLDDAQRSGEKALAIREEMSDDVGISAALMILGDIYLRKKEFEKAKEALAKSLQLRSESTETLGYFATLIRWVELHIETGEIQKARELAQRGLKRSREEGGIPYGIMRFLMLLGRIDELENNFSEAKEKFLESLVYAEKSTFRSVSYEILESIGKLYEREGNYKSALEYYRKFHSIKEEVISMQSNTKLKSIQFLNQVEFAKKEAELEKIKNTELQKAYTIIEEKNKDILDSFHYAKRIQASLLPGEKYIERHLRYLFEKQMNEK
ncbi:MAG: tetratricopeptide repeat protein [Bacteroidetes bacterium]|nr:tetratricopeptide repeat protein [Bacteroidota bacterium]